MSLVNALDMSLINIISDDMDTVFFIKDRNNDIGILTYEKIKSLKVIKDIKILTEEGWLKLKDINIEKTNNEDETKLEYYTGGNIISNKYEFDKRKVNMCAVLAAGNREHASVTKDILNSTIPCKKMFLERFERYRQPDKVYSKQIMASLQYLKMCIGQ